MAVKFMKHYVQDGALKVKVYYWKNRHNDGVMIAAKEYGYGLHKIFPDAVNDTDIMTDYFDKSCVTIMPGHWAYKRALERVA